MNFKLDNTGVELLQRKGVKATSNRILVINALLSAKHPQSLSDIEDTISTMDKSSIFRVLNLFRENDVVHSIEDGSGVVKYELCMGGEECTISDMHVHFYCKECHQTYCFEQMQIPVVVMPEGFVQHSVNYVVKGLCPSCRKKK